MRKNSHFLGQPLYGQVIKFLDKSKILQFSRENGGERYTKRFNCWTIAATMFTEEILKAYISRQPIHDFRSRIQSVNAVKRKDGRYALRITMNDGMPIPMIPMDSQDESDYCRLSPDDRQDYLLNLAVHYLTREDARAIIQRIRQTTKDQIGVRVLSHPQDFTQQTANVFALNFAKVLTCFNVNTDRGENREWEVGNQSRYDDLDTKPSGLRMLI